MRLDMVGRMPSQVLGVLMDLIQKLMGNDGELWLERTKRMLKGENPFAELVSQSTAPATWKDELVAMARRKLKKFSRAWADQVTAIPDTWTPEFLANAAMYNLKPVFFPDADINESFRKKSYTKLGQWFYDKVRSGDIKGDGPTKLRKGWYLADFTVGTDYTDGSQVFPNDPWAPLITRIRTDLEIGRNDKTSPGSRFAITWNEWDSIVLAHMASKLMATRAQTTLERAIEFNFIGNVYDPNRDRFTMWEWFRDVCGDSGRLIGGDRARGGLAGIDYFWRAHRVDLIAGRPLVRFVQ